MVTPRQYRRRVTTQEFEAQALATLRALVNSPEATFRDGQLEAIAALVEDRTRVLVVQRTGWGKSAVYFVATRLLRDRGAGPTVIVSPLLALMRNQISAGERGGITSVSINSNNRDEWDDIADRLDRDEIDVLLISPERFANTSFRDTVLPTLAPRVGMLVVEIGPPRSRRTGSRERMTAAAAPALEQQQTRGTRWCAPAGAAAGGRTCHGGDVGCDVPNLRAGKTSAECRHHASTSCDHGDHLVQRRSEGVEVGADRAGSAGRRERVTAAAAGGGENLRAS